MNATGTQHIEQQLALEQAVREELDAVVRAAAQTVTLLRPGDQESSGMKENQIRNVINVARESGSVDVTTNFIRYQLGRSEGKPWRYKGFGLAVIEAIETGVVAQAAERAGQQAGIVDPALLRQAHVTLMQHYLGYLDRTFSFCGDAGRDDPRWAQVARSVTEKEVADVDV